MMKISKLALALFTAGILVSGQAAADTEVGSSAVAGGLYDVKITESTGTVSVVTTTTDVELQSRATNTSSYSILSTITPTAAGANTVYIGRTGSGRTATYAQNSSVAYANDGNTALGEGARAGYGVQQNPNFVAGTSNGAQFYAGGQSTAVGADSTAILGGTAIGQEASATGRDSVAVGKEAAARGWKSIAVGEDTAATGAFSSAVGNGSAASAKNASAFGVDSVAEGEDSTALGAGAEATGRNSVALGAGSVASRNNTVSVGSAGAERTISNVADGIYATDAVNLRQLENVERKLSSGIAAAMAFTVPTIAQGKSTGLAIGAANYNGASAMSLNLAHKFTDEIIGTAGVAKGFNSASTSRGNNDDIGIKASVSWSF